MTDLTDRMRTLAAYMMSLPPDTPLAAHLLKDTTDLLIEASNVLESCQPQPEPMEIIEPVVQQVAPTPGPGTWTDYVLPWVEGQPIPRSPRTCPKCDSRAIKRVRRQDNHLMLVCPVCAETWEFKP